MAESTLTYTEQIDFWHWGELFTLSHLVDSARQYCLELILAGKSKLECHKELQAKFNVNKRYCNSIYIEVQAIVSNANENRVIGLWTKKIGSRKLHANQTND